MSERPVEDRVARGCDVCGGVDVHPRHVTSVTEGGVPDQGIIDKLLDNGARGVAFAEILEPTTRVHHFDCGQESGCNVCAASLDDAPKNARHGDQLIAHLTKGM